MAGLLLEIVEGDGAGKQVALDSALDIGREASLPLALDDVQVSRRHARVAPQDDLAVVEDLGSTNGTFVNDQPIQAPRAIRPGDRIRVGLTVFELRTKDQVAARPSAVVASPQITAVGQDVLAPAPAAALAPVAAAPAAAAPAAAQGGPQFLAPETPPAFVPPEVVGDIEAESDYNAVARLVDTRVKRQTNIAAFALIGAAAIAVVVAFGL